MSSRAQKLNELRSKRAAAQAEMVARLAKAKTQQVKPPKKETEPLTEIQSSPDKPINTQQNQSSPSQKYGYMFFYINLNRATERKTRMEEQLTSRGIQFERVEAIDATTDPLTDFIPSGWKGNLMSTFKAEIATTISHLKAIKHLVDSNKPAGVILEDDAIFEYEPMWPYTLKEVIDNAPKGWELLTLSITTSENRMYDGIMQAKRRYHHRKSNFYSAVAYALTRAHAISILNRFSVPLDPNTPFKCRLSGNISQMQSEINILGTSPHRYFLYPPAFTYPTDNNSYIHPNHIQGHKNCKAVVSRAYNVNDPFYFMPVK